MAIQTGNDEHGSVINNLIVRFMAKLAGILEFCHVHDVIKFVQNMYKSSFCCFKCTKTNCVHTIKFPNFLTYILKLKIFFFNINISF